MAIAILSLCYRFNSLKHFHISFGFADAFSFFNSPYVANVIRNRH